MCLVAECSLRRLPKVGFIPAELEHPHASSGNHIASLVFGPSYSLGLMVDVHMALEAFNQRHCGNAWQSSGVPHGKHMIFLVFDATRSVDNEITQFTLDGSRARAAR